MILPKENFAVVAAASDDSTRPSIQTVKIENDGTTVATNGAVLFRVGGVIAPEAHYLTDYDFPALKGPDGKELVLEGKKPSKDVCVLTKDAAREVYSRLKKIGKGKSLPILETAFMASAGNGTRLFTTDLDSVDSKPVLDPEDGGWEKFPEYEQLFPTSKPVCTIKISVANLRLIADFVAHTSECMRAESATVTFTAYEKEVDESKRNAQPIHFSGGTTKYGQVIDGLVMPMRK